MANRHLSRSIVLQTLFEWDFIGMQDDRVQDILRRNVEEFAPENNDMPFMHELTDTIIKKRTIVDQIIEKAAPDWPIDKISISLLILSNPYKMAQADPNITYSSADKPRSFKLLKSYSLVIL